MAGSCEIALPIPLRTTFTYAVPDALDELIVPGARVVVPFRNRAVVGVALERGTRTSANHNPLRDVTEVLDPLPALPEKVVELGRWVASYYLAPVGETFRAMLPPAVELRVAREWQITDTGRERLHELQSLPNRSQAEVADLALLQLCEIQNAPIGGGLIRKLPGGEVAAARLLRRGQMTAREVALHKGPRRQKVVSWNENRSDGEGGAANGRNARGEKRAREAEARVATALGERWPLPLTQLLHVAGVSRTAVERMARIGKVLIWEEPIAAEPSPLEADFSPPSNTLNEDQLRAASEIERWIAGGTFHTALLHGVTGSGKTEVYLGAVAAALARGRTALVLVPEIALTLWMSRLCRARFGNSVAVLHSTLGDQERAAEWWRARRGDARVVIGTRSAVFAPIENVGTIIVDEEHESSYKQEETPRYHGRDVAVMRAKLEGAVALLGSATPSLESFHHARLGKYTLLSLNARVENRPMAPVEIVDLREDFRQTHKAGPVSERLRTAIAAHLAAETQALVLINRRGYSWFAMCRSCGTAVLCENCSIALTFHKKRDRLACHYCGFSQKAPRACRKCNAEYMYFVGAGSEQLEERLRELFPQTRIARLDRDTARSKRAFEQVLNAFAEGRIDILVGTQMVAKGHDFQRVTLVGVMAADAQLGFPDFRAGERTFQLLTQVAGRAGRGTLRGEVLVETHYPEHFAIQFAARQDYLSFFEKELHFRRMMHYPPFTALASLLVRDTKVEQAIKWSRQIAGFFEAAAARGIKALGPAAAPLARIKREYRFQFLLKSPRRAALNRLLSECLAFCAEKEIPERAILLDVDPVNLL